MFAQTPVLEIVNLVQRCGFKERSVESALLGVNTGSKSRLGHVKGPVQIGDNGSTSRGVAKVMESFDCFSAL